jgi:hypothetical protein
MVLRVENEHDSISLLGIDKLRGEFERLLADADFKHFCGDCAGQGSSSSSSENGEVHVERLKEGRRLGRKSKR